MKKAEITIGGITYTHIGSPEAIEAVRKRLEEDRIAKPSKSEKVRSVESYNARNRITEEMLLKAKEVYQECKRLKCDRKQILTEVREAITALNGNCTYERAATLITEVRKRYNIHTIKYWSD